MHARHVKIHNSGRDPETAVESFRKNVYGVLRECEGFKGILFLINRETGEEIGMSWWDTEENMSASGEKLRAAKVARQEAGESTEGEAEKGFFEVGLFETS